MDSYFGIGGQIWNHKRLIYSYWKEQEEDAMTHTIHRKLLLGIMVFVFIGVGLGRPQDAWAASIFVFTNVDELNTNGVCSLREAITNANNNTNTYTDCSAGSGHDTIVLELETYTLTLDGADDNANLTGDLDITDDLSIQGGSRKFAIIQSGVVDPTTSSCRDCDDRVMHIIGDITVVLFDLTIRYGNSPDGDPGYDGSDGGGILNYGHLTLNNCSVVKNRTGDGGIGDLNIGFGGRGGGIFNYSELYVNSSQISYNMTGKGGDGGGSYPNAGVGGDGGGIASENSTPTLVNIDDAYITDNVTGDGGNGEDSSSGDGGRGNRAGRGGGIYCNACDFYLDNSRVAENQTGDGGDGGSATGSTGDGGDGKPGGSGGGIYLYGDDTELYMEASTVAQNSTGVGGSGGSGSSSGSPGADGLRGYGGGFTLNESAYANVTTSTIYENLGFFGGGFDIGSGSTLWMSHSTVSNNDAEYSGGGIGVASGGSSALIYFSTFTLNTANWNNSGGGDGGGIYVSPSSIMTLQSTIVAENSDKDNSNPDCWGSPQTLNYNLIGIHDSPGCSFLFWPEDLRGTHASPLDPVLSILIDLGGPTWTHGLKLGVSPGIDQIPKGAAGCFTTHVKDQRGVFRFPQCDIGAFELDQATHLYLPLVLR